MIGLGHTEQVGDDQHRERVRELPDEFAAAIGQRGIVLAVG